MNVLVTGGSGFVGRAVVRELRRRGHDVTVLTRQVSSGKFGSGITLVRADLTSAGDITDLVSGHGFDGICHLGGLTGIRDSFIRPATYFDVNVGGAVNLLKGVRVRYRRTGTPTAIVFASSRAVYAPTPEVPIAETHPAIPASPYGVTKRAVEQLLDFEKSSGGLGATILRCFNVAGGAEGIVDSDEDRLIPRLIGAIDKRLPPVQLGSLRNRRDFVHVMDVARAFAAGLDRVETGTCRVYNVGTGHATMLGEVLALLEQVSGKTVPRDMQGADGPPDTHQGVADISLIRADLGWAPTLNIKQIVCDSWKFSQMSSPERSGPRDG